MKAIKYPLLVFALLILTFLLFVYAVNFHPPTIKSVPVIKRAKAPLLQPGQKLTILSWNVQFFAGNKSNHFAFEGGHDRWPTKLTVKRTLRQSISLIKKANPDVIVLQELQKKSVMSAKINQLNRTLSLLPTTYANYSCAYYLKSAFVPDAHYWGPVDQLLCIISKFNIQHANRRALPSRLNTNFIVQQFQPKRAVLTAILPVTNGTDLHIINTHFSAFSQGTDTIKQQAKITYDIMQNIQKKGGAAILAGDFNLLGHTKLKRFVQPQDQAMYEHTASPLTNYFISFNAFPNLQQITGPDKQRYATYIAKNKKIKKADRTIDFIFITHNLSYEKQQVLQKNSSTLSDHYPLLATIKLPS